MSNPHIDTIVSAPNTAPPRSPPLAFAKTSNDSLLPRLPPPYTDINSELLSLSPPSVMGLTSPQAPESELDLQMIVDQQASALQSLHDAFAAERQVWSLERDRLYNRITSLERLLKTRDHHRYGRISCLSCRRC